ncbi:MAG: hypothetical protein R2680_13815 [Nitrososphaeraceae archaeon]
MQEIYSIRIIKNTGKGLESPSENVINTIHESKVAIKLLLSTIF